MFNPEKQISDYLIPRGYKRDRMYWFKETGFHFYFLAMYKNKAGGPDRYLDIGCTFKVLIPEGNSFKKKWTISRRIEPDKELYGCLSYFHQNASLTDEERAKLLNLSLERIIAPELDSYAHVESLLRLRMGEVSKNILLREIARLNGGAK